ncbi:MAG: prepilin-type N-terminal cleavage/methylation domain-containing protein [Candidatus Riflebacteria bacterium]|nr:prepilin-type N-terminal cleavage/methylation domain-containing protein [Candidatus Riflebacteria bacterium]
MRIINKIKNKSGLTFIEVVVACLLLAVILLPVFNFLNNSVQETERIYVEVMATSRAKQIMDTILFQIPWRALREGNPCVFHDPLIDDPVKKGYKEVEGSNKFMHEVLPEIFDRNCQIDLNIFKGDALIKDDYNGFWIRARVKVVDLDKNLTINILRKDGSTREFQLNELTSKDADGKYNLVKKVIVQVKWSWLKGVDPNKDPRAKSLFLVGFKSNLEG